MIDLMRIISQLNKIKINHKWLIRCISNNGYPFWAMNVSDFLKILIVDLFD